MEPWQEPVRGATLPPAAYTLNGLERLRGYGRRLWLNTPLHHLLGYRTTQAANGSAVGSLPVTGWLAHPDGVIDVGILATGSCGLAAYTVIPPGSELVPIQTTYSPVRLVNYDTRKLVGRASVVRTSPDWIYAEGSVEDDQGRVVADISGHMAIQPVSFPFPDEPPALQPQDPPRYPSPDPYQRPVPADKYQGCEQFRARGCVEWMGAIRTGDAPRPPLYEILGIRPLDVVEGSVSSALTTSEWQQGMDPGVFPGIIDAFATDACGAIMWTLVRDRTVPAVLQVSITHLDRVPADGRTLTAHAHGERVGNVLLTTVDVWDGERRVASGNATGRLLERRPARSLRPTRALVTVLFTDIVGSTERARAVGDAEWNRLLSKHDDLVRSALERHAGREVKTTGDGVLATFESPTQAVECASDISDEVARLGIEIRAGIHTGECEMTGGDIAGIAVHAAARIEAAAGAGEVWVSETTKALTAGSNLTFAEQGEHQLKGLDEPLRLYRLE